jgi:DNA-binding NtrC family response regulator
VLVVDPDEAIRNAVANLLDGLGYRVSKAADFVTAINLLAVESYDMVVTELTVRLANGYRLSDWLKQASPNTISVIMTGRCQAEVAKYMTTGLVDYWIFKPFRLNDLCVALKELGLPLNHQCFI